ncbi:uncharacterized protein L969DRAFT_95978 [Mixia osmundae IAM 14324]|uniref:VTT domain-containing protein n=1 Tax=Mixia osmundae (strain CBS 9802 / IAM 14324 / JCM 22182 / KY 12970) TaxID=764103 RepID=G7DWU9_MIXOS|nr:uncharacterized protein L969DRAFT_97523 [Mixia osmundae IAM 14324]XP_014566708.1 uncharacterized protein L969DRAFT_95978 [Mixia osmundae IAM 14324]KEI36177.1 hypothetical protein L969DRAFT_97523 [Mixia osmundae IAM 14324]KEI38145.1 hypothetical protein L969DRAFT_95978 [Mixia osmundae IAM 14324]GAA95046.1 hypothetical protein E5Q_01701 [Mixia osmundae IAM 14324]
MSTGTDGAPSTPVASASGLSAGGTTAYSSRNGIKRSSSLFVLPTRASLSNLFGSSQAGGSAGSATPAMAMGSPKEQVSMAKDELVAPASPAESLLPPSALRLPLTSITTRQRARSLINSATARTLASGEATLEGTDTDAYASRQMPSSAVPRRNSATSSASTGRPRTMRAYTHTLSPLTSSPDHRSKSSAAVASGSSSSFQTDSEFDDKLGAPSLSGDLTSGSSPDSSPPRTPPTEWQESPPRPHGKGRERASTILAGPWTAMPSRVWSYYNSQADLEAANDLAFDNSHPRSTRWSNGPQGFSPYPQDQTGKIARTGSISAPSPAVPSGRPLHALLRPMLILAGLFVISLGLVVYLVSTIPTLQLPHSLSDVRAQTLALKQYGAAGTRQSLHVFTILCCLFVFKQAFSIPGSILMNILFGALYGTFLGTIYTCLLTAVGSSAAYGMAAICKDLVERFFARPLAITKGHLDSNPDDLFSYLLLARFFPLLPYSVLNIVSGVLAVPLLPFFVTLVIGSGPYNFTTTQVGQLLAQVSAIDADALGSIWSPSLVIKLVLVTLISTVPLVFKTQLKRLVGILTAKLTGQYELISTVESDELLLPATNASPSRTPSVLRGTPRKPQPASMTASRSKRLRQSHHFSGDWNAWNVPHRHATLSTEEAVLSPSSTVLR